MKQQVRCPGCKIALCHDSLTNEGVGICPECGHLVLAADRADALEAKRRPTLEADQYAITTRPERVTSIDDLESLGTLHSVESKIEDLRWDAKELARDHDIRINEHLQQVFASKADLDGRLAELKRELPLVTSAYKPSGRMPMSALGWMLLGTSAAVLAGVAAEAIVGILAALVIGLIVLLNGVLAFLGCIWFVAAILGVIVGVLAYLAPFFAGGWAGAWVTTEFGRIGKNRSQLVAGVLSMFAGGLSVGVWWLVFAVVGLSGVDPLDLGQSWQNVIVNFLMGGGAIIAVLTGWFMAASIVQAAKFFEECEEFMDEKELKMLGIGGVKGMVRAIGERKLPLAASMLSCPAGADGKVMLFACPCCDAGFVEIELLFNGQWEQDGQKNDHAETWLVASEEISEYDVTWFRIFKEQGVRGLHSRMQHPLPAFLIAR